MSSKYRKGSRKAIPKISTAQIRRRMEQQSNPGERQHSTPRTTGSTDGASDEEIDQLDGSDTEKSQQDVDVSAKVLAVIDFITTFEPIINAPRRGRRAAQPKAPPPLLDRQCAFSFRLDISLLDLVVKMALVLEVDVMRIKEESLRWKFATPKDATPNPLRNEEEMEVFREMVERSKGKSVVFLMPKILKRGRAVNGEDEYGEEQEDARDPKRTCPDDEIATIMAELLSKYPIGSCPSHPDLHCYADPVSKHHFDLAEPNRRLLWATRIFTGICTYAAPPRTSHWYQLSTAIKTKPTPVISQPESTSSSTLDKFIDVLMLSHLPALKNATSTVVEATTTTCVIRRENFDVFHWRNFMDLKLVQADKFDNMAYDGEVLGSIPAEYWKEAGFVGLEWDRLVAKDRNYTQN